MVYQGKLIHENSYSQRPERFKEIEIGGCKIDFYDAKNKIIHEVKKSGKMEESHVWQLKYYIFVMEQAGVEGIKGILEYPKERETLEVFLSEPDRERIMEMKLEIAELISGSKCPDVINKPRCKQCSYFDFCYAGED